MFFSSEPLFVRRAGLELHRPGLGVELDDDALADKLGHDWRNRETYDDDDGSVVDW